MNILDLLKNEYVSIIAGGLGGISTAWLTQSVLNKRGTFTYSVTHTKIGVTSDDDTFGNVAVSWNGSPVPNLFLSTIDMKNESMNDYENVVVSAYTIDSLLMTEKTQLLDTPNYLEWSEKYKHLQQVDPGSEPTEKQRETFSHRREYVIPIFNRGQSIKITYLNSAKSNEMPNIWLSVEQKGVKLKFQEPQNVILGVPQKQAALYGVVLGIVVLIALATLVAEPWTIALAAMTYGLIAQLPGAYAIKALRRLRESIGG